MTRTAVLGAGSWGTAFSKVLADAGADVTLWGRRPELTAQIDRDHVNEEYLPDIRLPESIRATSDAARALTGAEVVVLALPSQSLRQLLGGLRELLPPRAVVVSLMKGVELGTTRRMSEVIAEVGQVPADRVAVLSGPNLAREIALCEPAASVVACVDRVVAEEVSDLCATSYFRPYTNVDVVGTELGGAVKNVIAIAVGMADGMGLGDNAKASIITRGLAETARLGAALGADPLTFLGLAGIGDLVATCMSPLSRNRTFGEGLGRGLSVEEVVASTRTTAEGVKSCTSLLGLAQLPRRRRAHHRECRGRRARRGGAGRDRAAAAVEGVEGGSGVSDEERRVRVAVVFGGRSSEHAVSCSTAASVLRALDRERYDVVPIGIARDGRWVLVADDPAPLELRPGQRPEVSGDGPGRAGADQHRRPQPDRARARRGPALAR